MIAQTRFSLLLLVAVVALPAASAQVNPVLVLSASPSTVTAQNGETALVDVTARNDGPADGQVTLTVTAPAGWSVAVAAGNFPLAAGASRTVRVELAPDPANPPAVESTVPVTGTLQDTLGRSTQGSVGLTARYVAPLPPTPPPPPRDLTVPIALSVVGAVLLFLSGAYLLQARLVSLEVAEATLPINTGTSGVFRVQVRNRSPRPVNVQLRLRGLTPPWSAALSFPTVKLAGHETTSVPIYVNVPLMAQVGGRFPFVVEARPNGYSPWLVRRRLAVTALDVRPGPASAPAASPA